MNTNKKFIYAIVCALALQSVVPAHASIWSSVMTWWNNVPQQSKRTAGIVAAGLTTLFALGYSAYALCKNKKKTVDVKTIEVELVPNVINAPKVVAQPEPESPTHAFMPVFAGVTQEELQQIKDAKPVVQAAAQQLTVIDSFAAIQKRYKDVVNMWSKYEQAYDDKQYNEALKQLNVIKQLLEPLHKDMLALRNNYKVQDSQYVALTEWIEQVLRYKKDYNQEENECVTLRDVAEMTSVSCFV